MYSLTIYLYLLGVAIGSIFNKKIKTMWRGEKHTFDVLKEKVDPKAKYVWFHAASLGEFEQGRPIMEHFRSEHPEYKILLTFFSPSGYEVRKNYEGADIVCYLPLDTPGNAKRFLKLVSPSMAFFIKYEFWWNYLRVLKKKNIPVYSVSSIFRDEQIFFKWYGNSYKHVLDCFDHFFVQNEKSRKLLSGIGLDNVTITGDTRFDRVIDIKNEAKQLPVVESFRGSSKVFVAGSSWAPDEDIFIKFFNEHTDWKLIIAPHVVNEEHVKQITDKLNRKTVRYTQTDEAEAANADCLIIDCYGMLSSIYNYGDVSYVGGGFGVGIHNVLEAAVWGMPVIFGPNNQRFQEAQELKAADGGFEIKDYDDFVKIMSSFMNDAHHLEECGVKASEYVASKSGATKKILSSLKFF